MDSKLFFIRIDINSYDQKPIIHFIQKLITIWLYFTSNALNLSELSTSNIYHQTLKLLKKEKFIKMKKKFKLKTNIKIEPTLTKQLQVLISETLLPKEPYIYT